MAAAAAMKMTCPRWSGWAARPPPPGTGACAVLLVKVCSCGARLR